jgi:hypothetical protein
MVMVAFDGPYYVGLTSPAESALYSVTANHRFTVDLLLAYNVLCSAQQP